MSDKSGALISARAILIYTKCPQIRCPCISKSDSNLYGVSDKPDALVSAKAILIYTECPQTRCPCISKSDSNLLAPA